MKNKFLRSFIILTLLISLIATLTACDNKDGDTEGSTSGGGSTTVTEGTLVELTHKPMDAAIDSAKKTEATKLLDELKAQFNKPFETEGNKFITSSGKMEVTANRDAKNPLFDYADKVNPTVYVDFSIESSIDTNQKANENKTQVFFSLVAQGEPLETVAVDRLVVYSLVDAKSQTVKFYSAKGTATPTTGYYNISDVGTIAASLSKFGTPNIPNDFHGILAQLDDILPIKIDDFVGVSTLGKLYDQQIAPLLTRMMFKKNNNTYESLVKKEQDGTYKFSIDANQVNTVLREFFERGLSISTDSEYTPLVDYRTPNGTVGSNNTDTHNNDSDVFFTKFSDLIGMANGFIKNDAAKLKTGLADWKNGFALSANAFTMSASVKPTDTGFTNGTFVLDIAQDATVKVPFVGNVAIPKLGQTTVKMYDLAVSAVDNTAVKAVTVPTDAKTKLDTLKTPTNLLAVETMYDFIGYKGNTKIETSLLISVDINPFEFLNIDATNAEGANAQYVDKAINTLDITIKDNATKNVMFSMVWDEVNKKVVITNNAGEKTEYTAAQIAKIISDSKMKLNGKISNKTIMDLVGLINTDYLGTIKSTKPTFIVETETNIPVVVFKPGFDKAVLSFFKTSYKDIFGKEVDIIDEIFGKNSGITKVEMPLGGSFG